MLHCCKYGVENYFSDAGAYLYVYTQNKYWWFITNDISIYAMHYTKRIVGKHRYVILV